MKSNIFENKLLKYFTEVIYVDSNPAVLKKETIFKENGKVKLVKKEKEINLKDVRLYGSSTNLMSPECGCSGIIDGIIRSKKSIDFKYKSKNILDRIFNNRVKKLNEFLNSEISDNQYIITTSKISKIINTNVDILEIDDFDEYSNKKLEDKIIIVKKSHIYLLRDFEKIEDINSNKVSIYYDIENFTLINLI